ncbi:hypothetical protein A3H21_04780 [Candidatus Woesebacteria bacterium RIFCSPLOWO2_12_FULL_42_8]|nr:MAG: hypothetical protein A3H21_04780 [Candidatus Woesebacteria bacterium RIFCSPLOWO2_12_FULL_42_8]
MSLKPWLIVTLIVFLGFLTILALQNACLKNQVGAPTPSTTTSPLPTKDCVVGGCSGELCVEEESEAVSICILKPEYECYKNATCARQKNGSCGWTQTPELTNCLENSLNKNYNPYL